MRRPRTTAYTTELDCMESSIMQNLLQITYWTIGGFEGQTPIRQALEEAKALRLRRAGTGVRRRRAERRHDAGRLPADPRRCRANSAWRWPRWSAAITGVVPCRPPIRPAQSGRSSSHASTSRWRNWLGDPDDPGHSRRGRRALGSVGARHALSAGLGQCHRVAAGTAALRRPTTA